MDKEFSSDATTEEGVAKDYARYLVGKGQEEGRVRSGVGVTTPDGSAEVKTTDDAMDTYAYHVSASAKIEGRSPNDGNYLTDDTYADRRFQYMHDTYGRREAMSESGRIGYGMNLKTDPKAREHFTTAFGDAGAKLHDEIKAGNQVLTSDQAKHLFTVRAREVEDHMAKTYAGEKRLPEHAHRAVFGAAMRNNGKIPKHIEAAYKTGDVNAIAKSIMLHKGKGNLTADEAGRRIITAMDIVGPDGMKKLGLTTNIKDLMEKINIPAKTLSKPGDDLYKWAKSQGFEHAHSLPMSAKSMMRVSSEFNPNRKHPITGKVRAHKGIDIAAKSGTSLTAINSGTVHRIGFDKGGWGNFVEIKLKNGHVVRYAHLSSVTATKGQKVTNADEIGKVGSTGGSTGPHLHLEYEVNGKAVNPRQYIKFQ